MEVGAATLQARRRSVANLCVGGIFAAADGDTTKHFLGGGAHVSRRAGCDVRFVLSCEHASAAVPAHFRELLRGAPLETHRGSDLGALTFARAMARWLGTELHATEVTRLLVDANRSEGRAAVFSDWTRDLSAAERAALIARFHTPHRSRVASACERALAKARTDETPVHEATEREPPTHASRVRMVHVAVHSFTPVLDGEVRELDVGLLYDPARPVEREIAREWQRALSARTGLRVRRNRPYRGVTDGLPTALRRALGPPYVGFELELNQALWSGRAWPRGLEAAVTETLREVSR